jgi:hypothetical protein
MVNRAHSRLPASANAMVITSTMTTPQRGRASQPCSRDISLSLPGSPLAKPRSRAAQVRPAPRLSRKKPVKAVPKAAEKCP